MKEVIQEFPVLEFKSADELRACLMKNHTVSDEMWVKIYKKSSGVNSVTFEEVLDEGLCFGWSESKRIKGDKISYLQRFTLHRIKGTTSKRNRECIRQLIKENRMTPSGLTVLEI